MNARVQGCACRAGRAAATAPPLPLALCRPALRLARRPARAGRRDQHADGRDSVGGRGGGRAGGVEVGKGRRVVRAGASGDAPTAAAPHVFRLSPHAAHAMPTPTPFAAPLSWTKSLRTLVPLAASERGLASAVFADPHDGRRLRPSWAAQSRASSPLGAPSWRRSRTRTRWVRRFLFWWGEACSARRFAQRCSLSASPHAPHYLLT